MSSSTSTVTSMKANRFPLNIKKMRYLKNSITKHGDTPIMKS